MNKSEQLNFKSALLLAILTIIVSVLETGFSLWFGIKSKSLTLSGFGLDSFIEVISAIGIAHMVWRIKHQQNSNRDDFEKTSLKITGYSFYVLAAGLTITTIYNLFKGNKPETGLPGIVISLIYIIFMSLLTWGKLKVGGALKSKAILGDAECSKVCIYMSIVLLVSSGIYELTGLAIIDAIGTLGIAYLSFKEGSECFEKALSDKDCGC